MEKLPKGGREKLTSLFSPLYVKFHDQADKFKELAQLYKGPLSKTLNADLYAEINEGLSQVCIQLAETALQIDESQDSKGEQKGQREQKIIEVTDTALINWQKPNISDSKERLIYKAECYHSALKEIQSLFSTDSQQLRTEEK